MTVDAIDAPVVTPGMFFYGSRLSENISRTPEGFLVCKNVPVARTGWQEYSADEIGATGGSERKVRVYRSPEEVFNPRSIATMEGKPVTEMHPPVFVSPYNYGSYLKGHVQNVRPSGLQDSQGEQLLLADLIIVDAGLINKIENGLREISVGYSCDYEPISDADYEQRNIVVNHVAVVLSARAGNDVRIYDSKEQSMANETTPPSGGGVDGGLGAIQSVVGFLKSLGFKSPTEVRDAESEAVKKQEEASEKATESQDDDDDDDDDKGTKDSKRKGAAAKDSRRKTTKDARRKAKDARARDDEDDPEEEDKRTSAEKFSQDDDDDDWHQRVTDLEERLANLEGAGDDDDQPPPPPPPQSEEEQLGGDAKDDHDLVPVETQAKEDRPKNPIPGAAQSTGDAHAVAALRGIRRTIARYGTRDDKINFNRAMAAAKGKRFNSKDARYGYGALMRTKKPDAVQDAELRSGVVGVTDSTRAQREATQFVDMAKQYHRKNPQEVVLQIPKLPA